MPRLIVGLASRDPRCRTAYGRQPVRTSPCSARPRFSPTSCLVSGEPRGASACRSAGSCRVEGSPLRATRGVGSESDRAEKRKTRRPRRRWIPRCFLHFGVGGPLWSRRRASSLTNGLLLHVLHGLRLLSSVELRVLRCLGDDPGLQVCLLCAVDDLATLHGCSPRSIEPNLDARVGALGGVRRHSSVAHK